APPASSSSATRTTIRIRSCTFEFPPRPTCSAPSPASYNEEDAPTAGPCRKGARVMNETTSEPMFEVAPPVPECSKGEREYRAFLDLLPALLPTCRGKFVAVHKGQVVDSDSDDIALVQRVHARIGYVPIHVGLVVEWPPVVRVPHYREYRPQG